MSGDYSRETFKREKHYSSVRMQQGRVQLDADWNEQSSIQNYRAETEAIDVIGQSGVPKKNGGFKIGVTPDGQDLRISAGRIYADGLLLELDRNSTYTTQPHFPNPEFTTLSSPPSGSPPGSARRLSLDAGIYLAILVAWQLEITADDDALIREVALGGPDTTTRIQNVWQVKLLRVGDTGGSSGSPPSAAPTCRTSFPAFDRLTTPSNGTLNAQTKPPNEDENPCLLPPSAGYSRLENQLYRVEIHTGGSRNQATFKFSRDNASVETKIKNIKGNVITVSDLGKDEVLGFAGGQWVEIVDEESTLKGTPHPLVQIDKVDPGTGEITLKNSVAALANLSGLKLRRWDQRGVNAQADGVSLNLSEWIDLEDGIQVKFSAGRYRAGDYWLIPARTGIGDIEWPRDESSNHNPIPQPPKGIRHHYSRLALIEFVRGRLSVIDDCRNLFPPLTELIQFFYVGGGGQEAMPGQRLPCTLQVGVTNGQRPVVGAQVQFKVVNERMGRLHSGTNSGSPLTIETDEEGIAQCQWELGGLSGNERRPCLQVEASLIDRDAGRLLNPPIRFNANFSLASQVAYDPERCRNLSGARTVQEALDGLCEQIPRREPGIKIRQIVTTTNREPLLNDRLLPVSRLEKGLTITCDRPISPVSVGPSPVPPETNFQDAIAGKPTCFVTLDLPYPIGQDRNVWDFNEIVGFQPLILGGTVSVEETQILWTPTTAANRWLQGILFRGLRRIADRVLAHLTLKGNFIFSPDARLHLDGEAFGRADDNRRIELGFPTGDDRIGGDFEMWFWLVESLPNQPPGLVLTVTVTTPPGAVGGVIRGSVKDIAGAVIPSVQVTVTEPSGARRNAVTNEQGDFSFPLLPRGRYKVSVQVGGASAEQEITIT